MRDNITDILAFLAVARERSFTRAAAKGWAYTHQNPEKAVDLLVKAYPNLDRDAELDWVAGGFGSKKGKTRIQNDLAGPGATSRLIQLLNGSVAATSRAILSPSTIVCSS